MSVFTVSTLRDSGALNVTKGLINFSIWGPVVVFCVITRRNVFTSNIAKGLINFSLWRAILVVFAVWNGLPRGIKDVTITINDITMPWFISRGIYTKVFIGNWTIAEDA